MISKVMENGRFIKCCFSAPGIRFKSPVKCIDRVLIQPDRVQSSPLQVMRRRILRRNGDTAVEGIDGFPLAPEFYQDRSPLVMGKGIAVIDE